MYQGVTLHIQQNIDIYRTNISSYVLNVDIEEEKLSN